jgi:hypothetical protein
MLPSPESLGWAQEEDKLLDAYTAAFQLQLEGFSWEEIVEIINFEFGRPDGIQER